MHSWSTCVTASLLLASAVHGALDQVLWSESSTQTKVCPDGLGGDCVIPADMEVTLDQSADLGSLKIFGSLKWDLAKDNLELKSGYMVAHGPSGSFELGTPENPMLKKATIYIKDNGKQHSSRLLSRVFGTQYIIGSPIGSKGPSIRIHGRKLTKTWSLMRKNAEAGDTSIRIEGDVFTDRDDGKGGGHWRVGDRIGVAPGGMMGERIGEIFTIAGLKAEQFEGETTTVITLSGALEEPKLGRPDLKLQCEVVNLERNVLMTGDDSGDALQGWHGIAAAGQFAPNAEEGGTFQVEYARQEKCGQARIKGSYCLHFHLMGDCGVSPGGDPLRPRCLFRGNALEEGYQRGLTVHGTHKSLVDNNVLWNVKGAGLYVEDGNEIGNTIQYNVNVCPYNKGGCHHCKVWGTDNGEADNGQQSGMWAMSPTNDFLFNRMVNHWNGFFMQTSFAPYGRGLAEGRVCTVNAPWGNFTGNVHHSNCRFGFYPDKNWPRRLTRSVATNGMVPDFRSNTDWDSCSQFTKDGRDNGAPAIVADGLDWGNNLVGQYDLGDVQYLRYHSVNNLHGMYWKATKNFATHRDWTNPQGEQDTWDTGIFKQPAQLIQEGALPLATMKDCKFDWYDPWAYPDEARILGSAASGVGHLYGPGGHGTFILEGGTMAGQMGAAIGSNQHCDLAGTGGMCAPTFEVNNVDTTNLKNTPLVVFGVSGGESRMASYSTHGADFDEGKYVGVAHMAMEYLLHLRENADGSGTQVCRRAYDVPPGNNLATATKYNWGIVCTKKLRRIQIWAPEVTPWPTIQIKGVSHTPQAIPYLRPFGPYPLKRGYGMPVSPGYHYIINGLEYFPGEGTVETGTTLEFSDRVNKDYFDITDVVNFTFIRRDGATRTCEVNSDHKRDWIGWEGAFEIGSGACLSNANDTPPTTRAPTPAPTPTTTTVPVPTPAGQTPAPPVPSPALPAPGGCTEKPCPYREWPDDMFECEVAGIHGTEIRTDIPLRKCNDCAERCWFQMPDCIGFLAKGTGDIEECTYYSSITGVLEGAKDKRAVLKSLAFSSLKPLPQPKTPGIRTPDGCNSHVPPMQPGKELDQETYLCVVESINGTILRTDNIPLDFYHDCAERCFLQMREECVGFRSRKRGDGKASCTYYSSIEPAGVVTAGTMTVATEFALLAFDAVPWHLRPTSPPSSPSPTPSSSTSSNFWVDNAGPIALGFIGVVLVGGIAAFCLRTPRRRLYGPQEDVEIPQS